MRSLLLSSVLGIAVLGLTATWPSQALAWRGGRVGWRGNWGRWHGGWWGGRSWYARGALYYPYAASYYPYYGIPYPPYAYYPPADYSTGAESYSFPEAGLGSSDSTQAELPHPTGGAAIPPPDAGLILLKVPDRFAAVSFNGQTVSSVGTTRDYVTPDLKPGETYRSTITVTWGQGDQQTTRQRTIEVARGQTRTVDFTAVSNASAK